MTDDAPGATAPSPPTAPRARDGGRLGAASAVVCAVGWLVLVAVAGLGRVVSAPPFWLAVLVVFLPYLFVAWTVLCFAVWTLAPDRRAPPIVLAGLVGVAGALWGPGWASRPDAEAVGDPLVMMSWNLRRLWGAPGDGGDPLGCTVEAVRRVDPDVLTLLEVSADDVDALSTRLGLTCVHHPYRASTSRKHGGLAACTRGTDWTLRSGAGQRFVDGEDWYYVFTEIEGGAGRVANLLAVHLHPYEYGANRYAPDGMSDVVRGQSDQSAALLERVRRLRDPTVIAGDFNSTRDAALHHELRRSLVDAWERGGLGFGATASFVGVPLRIDYVYATPDWAVADAEVPSTGCSDHRPVVTRLVLSDRASGASGAGPRGDPSRR